MYLFTESPRRHCETVKQLFDVPSGQSRKRPGVPGVITYAHAKKRASMQNTHLKFPDLERLHHCMSVLTKLSKKQIYFGMLAVINHGQRGQLPQEHANVKYMIKSWIPSVSIPLL